MANCPGLGCACCVRAAGPASAAADRLAKGAGADVEVESACLPKELESDAAALASVFSVAARAIEELA